MKQIPSKGSQKLLELQHEADLKKSINDSDSNPAEQELADSSNETIEEKRLREFVCGEVSYEALDNWGTYLREKSKKKV